MKTFKLHMHQSSYKSDDILINPKDYQELSIGDVVEIYHPVEQYSRLLLKVTSLHEGQQKDSVSVEQTVATAFNFRVYNDVIVNKVEASNVSLSLIEFLFKDQYWSRSDMWRFRNSMINTCVYLKKKLESSEMKALVNELWSKGEKVTCGYVTEDTRVVFRSSTAVVQIFLQMSIEMWDFDIYGDLYFEKAVNGFLTDLFAKWKDQNCLHDVTIVMFSRTFYEAQSIDEFPHYMRECVQQDYLGRFYEDFYRVVIQNERYEEWTTTLKQMRKLFNEYPQRVLHYHERSDYKVPRARNSTAARGNFLETLNMSLNLFEKYYIDRNFDRTGKVSVVITPGAGVFEVDRELTNITKQRTIDCGVGSDLVCMGEQPLHAVPLFRFHNKSVKQTFAVGDDYNIPHWMNHSFYTSNSQLQSKASGAFVPRIKPPPSFFEHKPTVKEDKDLLPSSIDSDEEDFHFVDYDEYDAQVWKLPTPQVSRSGLGRSTSLYSGITKQQPRTVAEAKQNRRARTRHISDDFIALGLITDKAERSHTVSSPPITIQSSKSLRSDPSEFSSSVGCLPLQEKTDSKESMDSSESEESTFLIRPIVGSAGSPVAHSRGHLHNYRPHRALINPFAPSRMQFKMTSNRRRWVHAFPIDPKGATVLSHHQPLASNAHDGQVIQAGQRVVQTRRPKTAQKIESIDSISPDNLLDQEVSFEERSESPIHSQSALNVGSVTSADSGKIHNHRQSILSSRIATRERYISWGPTGEENWTPDMMTGVDWKSLTIPASLPITTDYFPDEMSLKKDYLFADYTILLADITSDYWIKPPVTDDEKVYRRKPLETKDVFRELISQRLGQGFQLILLLKAKPSEISLIGAKKREEPCEEYCLSIGRIFHKLKLTGPVITVTRYRPRHPHPQMFFQYKYRFQAPDSYYYDVSWTQFYNEKLENYNWNYLDLYICTRGEGDYGLLESSKYWRSRFFLLPRNTSAMSKIIEGHSRCDIFEEPSTTELKQQINGFLKFIETLNKLRRNPQSRRSKVQPPATDTCDSSQTKSCEGQNSQKDEDKFNASNSSQIIEAMSNPQTGVCTICPQVGLPTKCFISGDAVNWCIENITGIQTVQQAVQLLQKFIDDGFICHCSADPKHKFIYGSYIYFIVQQKEKGKEKPDFPPINTLFQNEWFEVMTLPVNEKNEANAGFYLPESSDCSVTSTEDDWRELTGLIRQGWGKQSATMLHKYVNADVDDIEKSDRLEWSTIKYNAYYSPKCAFELVIQWMVSTGCVLGDMIINWARKSPNCGFHILPVPTDPFALPYTQNSDPLRGPIFVPLNVDSLKADGESIIYEEYDDDERIRKILLLQEAIVRRYGFLRVSIQTPKTGPMSHTYEEHQQQYVHCSGGMCLLIPDNKTSSPTTVTQKSPLSSTLEKKTSSELHKDYIARQADQSEEKGFGFLWSWNFMLAQKWRTNFTGDEHFLDKMLADFRIFCSSKDERLREFWLEYQRKTVGE